MFWWLPTKLYSEIVLWFPHIPSACSWKIFLTMSDGDDDDDILLDLISYVCPYSGKLRVPGSSSLKTSEWHSPNTIKLSLSIFAFRSFHDSYLVEMFGGLVFELRTNNVRLSVSSHLRLMERPHENQQSSSSPSTLDVTSEEVYSEPLEHDDQHSEYFNRNNGSLLQDPVTCPSPPKKKCKTMEPQFVAASANVFVGILDRVTSSNIWHYKLCFCFMLSTYFVGILGLVLI